jgi:hypothetical protein
MHDKVEQERAASKPKRSLAEFAANVGLEPILPDAAGCMNGDSLRHSQKSPFRAWVLTLSSGLGADKKDLISADVVRQIGSLPRVFSGRVAYQI